MSASPPTAAPTLDLSRLLTPYEAAHRFGVSTRSLISSEWRRRYGVPTIRVGGRVYFEPAAFQEWLVSRREGAAR